jgi:hypothetical protein
MRFIGVAGRLPIAHGIKLAYAGEEPESVHARIAAALELLERIDPDVYQTARREWRVIIVRPLPNEIGVRWTPLARMLEVGAHVPRALSLGVCAALFAQQAAVAELWPKGYVSADAESEVRARAREYAEWFAEQLPAEVLSAHRAGAS